MAPLVPRLARLAPPPEVQGQPQLSLWLRALHRWFDELASLATDGKNASISAGGTRPFVATQSMGTNTLTNLAPVGAGSNSAVATTKLYVDNQVSPLKQRSYITALAEPLLAQSRQLAAASPLAVTDGGPGAQAVVGVNSTATLHIAGIVNNGNLQQVEASALVAGTIIGFTVATASTQKLAFWGAIPAVQPAVGAAITDSTGGTVGSTEVTLTALTQIPGALADCALRSEVSARMATLNDDLATLTDRVNKLRAALVLIGLAH